VVRGAADAVPLPLRLAVEGGDPTAIYAAAAEGPSSASALSLPPHRRHHHDIIGDLVSG